MTTTYTPDSSYAWMRLLVSLALATIGGIGLWSSVVILPTIQAEFGIDRAGASLAFTVTTIGFAIGGVLMGRAADRFGITVPLFAALSPWGRASFSRRCRGAMGNFSSSRPC
jgi:MFS family permease